ncbi:hypothetical protein HYDPIDRAFT_141191 [Hydnomerulius pinastri MD-312]|uniref:Cytochrome P450 n=1 Tax=Hydnomerulius pinastri MD-312 TaxID=994086 RepID=A0A0C9VMM1_9AGAM|nr:hypothetical protein HYDPIDRAFT_141191 [Hydnomerulius pinastri MD-312]
MSTFLIPWVLIGTIALLRFFVSKPHNGIPVAGYSGPLLSYISCVQFLARAQSFLDNAYSRFRPSAQWGMFQLRLMNDWRVIVYGKDAMADVFNASTLPFLPMIGDLYQFSYTVHPSLGHNPDVHRPYLRYIISNLDEFLPDMMKEIERGFENKLSEHTGRFAVMDGMMETVFRAVNVILVGPHLAQDPVFRTETLSAIQGILGTGLVLKLSPPFARPFLHRLLKLFMPTCAKSQGMMVDEIRRRKRAVAKERGQWDHHGIDVLAQFARNDKLTADEDMLGLHFILLNLAGVFSTTMTLAQVVFDVIQQEKCLLRIREELRAAIIEFGGAGENEITPEVLNSCSYLDAFLKESFRMCNLGTLHISRKAVKDFTFSNGVRIPAGASVSIPVGWTHQNPEVYPDPQTFDVSRFALGDRDHGDPSHLDPDFLFFGYGKHACPGRSVAIRVIKCIVAQLVMKYDVRWAKEGFVPRPMWVTYYCVPDPKAEVVISRRDMMRDEDKP